MSSKHFINDPTHLVATALQSITLTNPNTAFDAENKVIYLRPDAAAPQVSIISGGGSGHEPSFAAFVGPGLLSGAVAGTIFASPSAEQVRRCISQRVETGKGVLVVVMNYTGDVLNFGMAVEKAKAAGIEVEMVVMGDDAAVGRAKGGKVGRRGIAGTVLIHKIAGALAATGASLKEVHKAAQAVADNTVSMGTSLAHVHVPGREDSEEDLKRDEVEIGMGIHNESGSERAAADLPKNIMLMLKNMLDQSDEDRAFLNVSSSDETVLLINNLGGVSVLEMGGIVTEVVNQLDSDYGIKPVRILAGTFMTSLNGLGFSISILKTIDLGVGKSVLELLDAPSEAAGWSAAITSKTWTNKPSETRELARDKTAENQPSNVQIDGAYAGKVLEQALDQLIKAEPEVTRYDTVVGDGDCGIGLKRGAEGIKGRLADISRQNDAALWLNEIIGVVETDMDGTSGALYAIFLNALACGIRLQGSDGGKQADPKVWAGALQEASSSLAKYTPAKPGDRTLVDALAPFVEELSASGNVQKAAQAAEEGAKKTKGMQASLGRTVYLGGSGFEEVPDPGAHGLSIFLSGLAQALQ
ncbi:Putative DhaK domain, DhaL domain, dihydroxyacetone kinase, DhaL domain superfamily [Septoria linicola]|uniref:DhaK domain, DhaL domain, dihydroxyacetone kinase, DhaL domain superfamily n=1 Tax=Septoria linicola TaxID=215465 RepID=A0A9Q9EGW8_9PEZI|nr:putative DhaK domain, DhaL domain, dihydroxyacetone kinase, DhaL domain superfamily [Septoria linicola]USW49364.1 Putative DhaK domain, DhaL domain, dihydroxyacetone kinase, DhaL domain superfamily [Septoria linicola]